MFFIRHIVLMIVVASMMQPAHAMDIEPAEALLQALIQGGSRALEDSITLDAAIATAEKLVQGKMIAIAQIASTAGREKALETLPDTMRIVERLKKQKKQIDEAERYGARLEEEWKACQSNADRERLARGIKWPDDYRAYEEDRNNVMEKWRDDVIRLDRQRAEEREKRAQEWARQQTQIKPMQLVAQAPMRKEKPRYTFQDARQAVARGDVAQLLEILDANVLSAASVQDLLGAACDGGNEAIVQILLAKAEQFNVPAETMVASIQFNPKGNSNIDEL